MKAFNLKTSLAAILLANLFAVAPSFGADCKTSLATLNTERNSSQIAVIKSAIETFKSGNNCSDKTINAALTQTSAIIAQNAQGLIEANNLKKAEKLLALAPSTHWLVQVSRADIAAKRENRAEAAQLYNASLDTILDSSITPNNDKLQNFVKRIAMLAQENTMLAGETANTISRSDGRATGVYGAISRGLTFEPSEAPTKTYTPPVDKKSYDTRPIKSTYIPIKFATDSDQLDHKGENEALKLAKFINSYHVKYITLTGHTDERGSHDYNQDLSERRARSLKWFLQTNGSVVANITTYGRGEKQPPELSDYSIYSIEQRQAIARRVEMSIE